MAKGKVLKVTGFLAKELKASGLAISKIILFGSHAAGRASAESDIDIVVVSEDFRGKNIFERVEMVKAAEVATIKKFVVPVDILLLTPEELESRSSLIAGYARAGKVLHAA